MPIPPAAANNGSAFAGLNGNTDYYNIYLGRHHADRTFRRDRAGPGRGRQPGAAKNISPPSPGTFPTNNLTFVFHAPVAVIIIVGALTFFPSLTLGPIAEHFLMLQGRTF